MGAGQTWTLPHCSASTTRGGCWRTSLRTRRRLDVESSHLPAREQQKRSFWGHAMWRQRQSSSVGRDVSRDDRYAPGSLPKLHGADLGHASPSGIVTLVHPPTHLTDAKGYVLRLATYPRLRRHWRFINEYRLFHEVHHLVEYSVNVYGAQRTVDFLSAVAIFQPSVVEGSLRHDGTGPEPGFKDEEGRWDVTPHRRRILRNGREQLLLWHALMESGDSDVAVGSSRMLSSVNHAAAEVLGVLSQSSKVGSLHPEFSGGWNETTDRAKGYFESRWGTPGTWRDVILQGPYFHVATPFAAERNQTMSTTSTTPRSIWRFCHPTRSRRRSTSRSTARRPPRMASSSRTPRPTTALTAPGCSNATARASPTAPPRFAITTACSGGEWLQPPVNVHSSPQSIHLGQRTSSLLTLWDSPMKRRLAWRLWRRPHLH